MDLLLLIYNTTNFYKNHFSKKKYLKENLIVLENNIYITKVIFKSKI